MVILDTAGMEMHKRPQVETTRRMRLSAPILAGGRSGLLSRHVKPGSSAHRNGTGMPNPLDMPAVEPAADEVEPVSNLRRLQPRIRQREDARRIGVPALQGAIVDELLQETAGSSCASSTALSRTLSGMRFRTRPGRGCDLRGSQARAG